MKIQQWKLIVSQFTNLLCCLWWIPDRNLTNKVNLLLFWQSVEHVQLRESTLYMQFKGTPESLFPMVVSIDVSTLANHRVNSSGCYFLLVYALYVLSNTISFGVINIWLMSLVTITEQMTHHTKHITTSHNNACVYLSGVAGTDVAYLVTFLFACKL